MKSNKEKRVPVNESKKRKKTEKKGKKQQTKKKVLKSNHQCPKCGYWFSSDNGIYNIHLSQCQLLQESLEMNIHQEQLSSNQPDENKKMMTSTRKPTTIKYSKRVVDFGCFTERLSRIDLKQSYSMGSKNLNDLKSRSLPSCKVESENIDNDDETACSNYDQTNLSDIHQVYERAWSLFKNVASKAYHTKVKVGAECIPFPPNSLDDDSLGAFGLTNKTPMHLKRARMRKLLIRWHPDKFLQLYGDVINENDLPVVMTRANDVIRFLTKLKATMI